MNHHPEYDYLHHYHPTPAPQPTPGIDWDLIAEHFPAFISALCWILWFLFLLIPSVFGLHYAAEFSAIDNAVYVGMGLILCLALNVAIRSGHGFRAVLFTMAIVLLSIWF